ncbi:hypothetical protein BH10PSE7_BH10PSE7_33370 [soil metagenome]
MAKIVMLALLVYGGLELFLLVKTGQWFGAWFPVLGVFAGLAAGGFIIRHEGLKSIDRLRSAMRSGAAPGGPAVAGLAGVAAGILLIMPGFISDGLALLLLMPWSRLLLFKSLMRGAVPARARGSSPRPAPNGPIIDVEAIETYSESESGKRATPWNPDRDR